MRRKIVWLRTEQKVSDAEIISTLTMLCSHSSNSDPEVYQHARRLKLDLTVSVLM